MCSRRCALPAVALAPTPSFRNIYTQPPARHATLAAGTRHPEALAVTLTPANGDIHCHAMFQAPVHVWNPSAATKRLLPLGTSSTPARAGVGRGAAGAIQLQTPAQL